MPRSEVPRAASRHRLAVTGAVAAALALGACADSKPKFNLSPAASSVATPAPDRPPVPPAERAQAEKQAVRAAMMAKAEAEPKDVRATILAARALKAEGKLADALQIVERSAAVNPKDASLQREAGLLALDGGQPAKAEKALKKAIEFGDTAWQTRSALGAALAAQAKHSEAQLHLAKALEIAPDHPAILNNLALSYMLDKKPAEAENVLRIAAGAKGAPRHVQHNLALVLGARGKTVEAERVATAASTPAKATANAAYVKSLAQAKPDGATPVAAQPQPAPAVRSARAPGELDKPYMLGAGVPKDGN